MRGIEEVVGYKFKDEGLLREALTHKSYSAEHRSARDNERLEFLGDSVVGLAVAHFVYQTQTESPEGKLAKLKSWIVSRQSLCEWARQLHLGKYLLLGLGEEQGGGRERETILANAMEAIIGAIYLDGGYAPAKKLIDSWLQTLSKTEADTDYKSALQEIIQKKRKVPPEYEITQTVGPEHDKIFTVAVMLNGEVLGTGKGKNKKEAEQAAAKNALDRTSQLFS